MTKYTNGYSTLEVSQMTGVSLNTLTNWHKSKPKLFAVVLAGCLKSMAHPEP